MGQPHSTDFRRHALALVRAGNQSVSAVALELGVSETTLRNWVRAADERASAPADRFAGRRELDALARQVRALEIEIDLVKRAVAGAPANGRRRTY